MINSSSVVIVGGCGWGIERLSSNQKVGSSIPSLHAEVSFGKMLNPDSPS